MKALFLLSFFVGASFAQAATPVLTATQTNFTYYSEGLTLKDGVCVKTGLKIRYQSPIVREIPSQVISQNSTLCKMARAGAIIAQQLGECSYKYKATYNKKSSRTVMVAGYEGVSVGAGRSLSKSLEQPCTCAESLYSVSNSGPGMFDPSLLFDGPYYRKTQNIYPVSAEVCASFFSTEHEKNVVRAAYKKVGL